MAAAPNAWITNSVNTNPFKLNDGANNTPDIAANVAPISHARRRTTTGLAPVMAINGASSTTPRMAIPVRVTPK